MNAGEHCSLLIEVNGPGGMYAEVARTMVLGKATQKLNDEFSLMKEAQGHTLSQGVSACLHKTPKQIFEID